MGARSVECATFVIERTYAASPERTVAAWAEPEAEGRRFRGPETEFEVDFRVGGWERHWGIHPDGHAYAFQAVFQDIVPAHRIVYTDDMLLDETRIPVSLATVEFRPEHGGTCLVFIEQGAFLDDHVLPAQREHGMGSLLDALGEELQSDRADA